MGAVTCRPPRVVPLIPAFLVLLAPPSTLRAQAAWTSVDQAAFWVSTYVDHGVTPRLALWFDGHWRRDGAGAKPQQLLLRPGFQLALTPRIRVGGGYGYVATAPYGEVPLARPLREHRAYQQVSVASAVGSVSVANRFRFEERWVGQLASDGSVRGFAYQTRIRHYLRVQRALGTARLRDRPLTGFVANEFFLPVGHSDGEQGRYQNRSQIGAGVPLGARQRIEASYLHQWSRITPRRTHERNHTLQLSWSWASRVAR